MKTSKPKCCKTRSYTKKSHARIFNLVAEIPSGRKAKGSQGKGSGFKAYGLKFRVQGCRCRKLRVT